jgi:type IV pilus assembly protein PilA
VLVLGVVAVLAIYGVRKYIANSKTAEAKNSLGFIAKSAAVAYEAPSADDPSVAVSRLCPSSSAVPRVLANVRGMKYQSARSDWNDDPGWKCLRYEMSAPQYYQYQYKSTKDGFDASAVGDLDGDGTPSLFVLSGAVQNDRLRILPTISESAPEE